MVRRVMLVFLFSLSVAVSANACLWDHDTLQMERARFPETLELITGKFLRHSPDFYRWRIQDRLQRLEADPTNARLLDDLGVAYDKIGDHEKAIETALKLEKLHPGRYETSANLGTFYIHGGKYQEGLPYLDKAIKINPQAHFGREIYQKWLVEYVISKRVDGQLPLPMDTSLLSNFDSLYTGFMRGYLAFIYDQMNANNTGEGKVYPKFDEALKGILGIMKFGKHDSPVILEVLAESLLTTNGPDAKQLAARAYLKASYEAKSPESREKYRGLADRVLDMQTGLGNYQSKMLNLETQFKKELAEAKAWYAELEQKEKGWIASGQNPEVEFDKLYFREPRIVTEPPDPNSWSYRLRQSWPILVCFGTFVLVVFSVGYFSVRKWLRSRRKAQAPK